MSWELFKKIVDEASNKGCTARLHMIGEPLLHKSIVEMINYAEDNGIRTSISTNCLMLGRKMAKKLIHSRLRRIVLCLDSMNETVYSKLRQGSNYKKVIENIDQFIYLRRQLGGNLQIALQFIIMKDNIVELKSAEEKYAEMLYGFGYLRFKQFSTFGGHVDDRSPETTPARRFSCTKTLSHLAIHWNGDCVICCRDFDGFTKVGNLFFASIEEVWNASKYGEYRDQFSNKDWKGNELCRNC